jgi:hypothetical protein
MRKVLSLIALGAIYRLIPHPVNAVPMGALSLYAGASLSRRWAWIIPVAAMALSDLALLPLDAAYGRPFLDPARLLIYATFALTTLLGPLARRPKVGPWLLPLLSLSASALFFLTSNFGAWLMLEMNYPRTLAGLLTCYAAGLPFIGRTILADLAGTAVLFGLGSLLERASSLLPAREPAAPVIETQTIA